MPALRSLTGRGPAHLSPNLQELENRFQATVLEKQWFDSAYAIAFLVMAVSSVLFPLSAFSSELALELKLALGAIFVISSASLLVWRRFRENVNIKATLLALELGQDPFALELEKELIAALEKLDRVQASLKNLILTQD